MKKDVLPNRKFNKLSILYFRLKKFSKNQMFELTYLGHSLHFLEELWLFSLLFKIQVYKKNEKII